MIPEDTEEDRQRLLQTLTRLKEERARQVAHDMAIWVVLGSIATATVIILYVRCTKGHL